MYWVYTHPPPFSLLSYDFGVVEKAQEYYLSILITIRFIIIKVCISVEWSLDWSAGYVPGCQYSFDEIRFC